MLRYAQKGKSTFNDFMTPSEPNSSTNNLKLNPKYLPQRPPALNISAQTTPDPVCSPVLTPKSSRTPYNPNSQRNYYNRPYNVTPEMHKTTKDCSFKTPTKSKLPANTEKSYQKDENTQINTSKTDRNDLSQKAIRTKNFKDVTNIGDKNFLRQTVSNANVWQLRNMNTHSPIKQNLTSTLRI